jgi:hypothetical protein
MCADHRSLCIALERFSPGKRAANCNLQAKPLLQQCRAPRGHFVQVILSFA